MKKNVIALAVMAAMAAPLAAQADVTVGGSLQAELESFSGDTTEGMVLASGNRGKIEFKASEDLGNGLKAIAMYGMNADVDGKTIGQRDAYVGLSGGFGTILAGTMTGPYKGVGVAHDPLVETGAQARGNNGMSDLMNGYTGNAIAYANKFGMANVKLAYVIDEGVNTALNGDKEYNNENAVAASVVVPVGPVTVSLGYQDVASVDDGMSTILGVKYAAGAIGVAFVYETVQAGVQDQDVIKAANAADPTLLAVGDGQTNMYANVTYTAGANTFILAAGQEDSDYKTALGDADTSMTYTTLAVSHAFSKNTNAYAAYMGRDNDGTDFSVIAVGMRVNF